MSIRLNADAHDVNISFKRLTKDLKTVISLLAEELCNPRFDPREFELLKNQNINLMKRGLEDPETQASIQLSQLIYPQGHPNYLVNIETSIEELEKVTLDELKAFHKNYFGTSDMHLVAVGNVDNKTLYAAINNAFEGWTGGATMRTKYGNPTKNEAITKVVTIPEKPSAVMQSGQYTGIEIRDKDFLPFYIGTSILGGGFSARLMQTVRDRDGLTYSINARHLGHTNARWILVN